MKNYNLLDQLESGKKLNRDEFITLLKNMLDYKEEVFLRAQKIRKRYFHNKVYIRGLVEFSNICKNDCYYCGIRSSNKDLIRYRLCKKDIEDISRIGKSIGLGTFVLQGGEDPYFTDEMLIEWIQCIRKIVPEAAITLSIGERSYESYKKLKEAGVNRFLLRHESINTLHYSRLHPENMKIDTRIKCLKDLKKLKYEVGSGFMVGSPYQDLSHLAEDLCFLQVLQPEMIGIGPFISHKATPFSDFKNGDVDLTLYLIGILRIMFPRVNLPATTALQTLSERGRIQGVLAGANVFMPNLTPVSYRQQYSLYDNKASYALEAMENLELLKEMMKEIGYEIDMSRGDYPQEEEI